MKFLLLTMVLMLSGCATGSLRCRMVQGDLYDPANYDPDSCLPRSYIDHEDSISARRIDAIENFLRPHGF